MGVEGQGGCDLLVIGCTPGDFVTDVWLCCLHEIGRGAWGVCVCIISIPDSSLSIPPFSVWPHPSPPILSPAWPHPSTTHPLSCIAPPLHHPSSLFIASLGQGGASDHNSTVPALQRNIPTDGAEWRAFYSHSGKEG